MERDGQTDERTDRQNCYINIARQCADARKSEQRRRGGAENDGHEIAGHENGGPNSRT